MDPLPVAPPVLAGAPIPGAGRNSAASRALFAGAILTLALSAAPAGARVWTVLAGGGGSAPTVHAAADSAADGDTLQIGPGVFENEHVSIVDKTLLIRGAGRDLTELNGFPHGHVFYLRGYDNYTEIRDLTIRNGVADVLADIYGGTYGGGVYGEAALFALVNCRITECTCLSLGAGIYFTAVETPREAPARPPAAPGAPGDASRAGVGSGPGRLARRGAGDVRDAVEIRGCLIDNCTAGAEGGGFYAEKAFFRIDGCEFRKNTTVDGGGGSIASSLGTLTGCLLRENQAGFDGGGLRIDQGLQAEFPSIMIAANTFAANEAARSGAGIMIARGYTISFERNIFAGQAGAGGEAIFCRLPDGEYHGSCNHFWANGSAELPNCQPDPTDTTGDPLFCDPEAGDYRVCAVSPALAGPCGRRGAFGVGCAGPACGTPTLRTTWGAIKSLYR